LICHAVVEQIRALEDGRSRTPVGQALLAVGPIIRSVRRERLTSTSNCGINTMAWPRVCTGLSYSIRRDFILLV
jgi:hypothetical protein